MMIQDNRPNRLRSDTFDARMAQLRNLLNEPSDGDEGRTTESVADGKTVQINVTGNNNVISADKARSCAKTAKSGRDWGLVAATVALSLFF